MGENGYWATKTYRCGRIGEKVKFFVPSRRGRPREKSSQEKIASNAVGAVRWAARCINENFRPGDGWLTLTYDRKRYARVLERAERQKAREPQTPMEDCIWFAAAHEGELLMDRARRALRKQGIELKYFMVTSDMDGDSGELVRVHHHVIVPAECREMVKKKWGGAEFEDPNRPEWKDRLWEQEDYTPLAEYMLKQVRHIPNAKKYVPSRNLSRSEPKPRRVMSGARIREPKGCRLLYAAPYTGQRDSQYIRYLLPPEQWTGVWKESGRRESAGRKKEFSDTTAHARARAHPQAREPLSAPTQKEAAPKEVRCPGCGKLLGIIRNGVFENKHGQQVIRTMLADVVCPKCGRSVRVGTPAK